MKRTTEEFKAEIFSRSEKIINKRKRINKIALCISPLVLCAVLSVYIIGISGNFGVKAENGSLRGDWDKGMLKNEAAMDSDEPGANLGGIEDAILDGAETFFSGSTAPVAEAIEIENLKDGTISYQRNVTAADKIHSLIETVIENGQICDCDTPLDYEITVFYSDNTSRVYGICENTLITEDKVYFIDSGIYDSFLFIIDGILG